MDIFWSVFVRGKYATGWEMECWKGVKKLFIDRLREKKEWEYWLPIGWVIREWNR